MFMPDSRLFQFVVWFLVRVFPHSRGGQVGDSIIVIITLANITTRIQFVSAKFICSICIGKATTQVKEATVSLFNIPAPFICEQ